MATITEIQQAESIVFRIQGGESIRTDPRSTVGRLVNQALQRTIDLQQALRDAQAREQVQTLATPEDLAQQSFPVPTQTPIPISFTPIPTVGQQFERGRQISIEPSVSPLAQQQLQPIRDFGDIRQQTRIDIEPVKEISRIRGFFSQEVGIPLFTGVPGGRISLREIREGLAGAEQLPLRVAAQAIPTTRGGVAIIGGLSAAAFFGPPIIGTGIGLGIAGLSFPKVFDPGLLAEERIASGIFGGLGLAGGVAGVTPFLRGFGAKGVRTAPEGFQVLPGLKGVGDIGLIQPGPTFVTLGERTLVIGTGRGIDLPPTSPLVRGGFQVRPGEKAQFLGPEQFLTTSQRGLFEVGRDIPIEREFFVTPQEPTLGIAETRVSRLGLVDPFKFPESVEIGFGLPPRPQIGVTIGEVARTERAGAFAIGRGTELEAIRTEGIITDVAQIGRARIRGQGIDIFEFRVSGTPRGRPTPRRTPEDFISTQVTTRVPGEPLLGTLGIRTTRGISTTTSALVSPLLTTVISPDISVPISPPITSLVTPPISPGISTLISPGISPPISPGISPPRIPITTIDFRSPFEEPVPRRVLRGRRRKRKEKKVKRGERIITPIRPSFTGIVLGIESAAFVDPRFGVSPLEIRGLATGFEVQARRRKSKVKKKVTKKKSVKKKRKKK